MSGWHTQEFPSHFQHRALPTIATFSRLVFFFFKESTLGLQTDLKITKCIFKNAASETVDIWGLMKCYEDGSLFSGFKLITTLPRSKSSRISPCGNCKREKRWPCTDKTGSSSHYMSKVALPIDFLQGARIECALNLNCVVHDTAHFYTARCRTLLRFQRFSHYWKLLHQGHWVTFEMEKKEDIETGNVLI